MFAALILGFAGSFHCVGMCGPLVLAIPLPTRQKWQLFQQLLGYHLGRILTYGLLGIFFGLLGQGIAIAGFQKGLSIAAGIFMVVMALGAWRFEQLVATIPGFNRYAQRIQQQIRTLMRAHPGRATFSMGAINGLLPCGMVYAALAGAISTADTLNGGVFMLIFGAGTIPLLLSVSLIGHRFGSAFRQKLRYIQPVLLVAAGLLLLQRGLHLDLGLFESAVPKAGMDCH